MSVTLGMAPRSKNPAHHCLAKDTFPIHLLHMGKTIRICIGVGVAQPDATGVIPTSAIRKSERHDDWKNPLALAHQFKALLDDGCTRAEVAQLAGVSRARVTQVMNLLNLHPDIQEYLNQAEEDVDAMLLTERRLRNIAGMEEASMQLRAFRQLIS